MPPSTKRASVCTHGKPTKEAKRTKPATITRVPKWAEGLTEVVAAFENRDTDALRKALNAADPMLLNHIPKCWLPGEWHGLDFVNPSRKQCFFNACTGNVEGHRPLSLVSCATYMLSCTWERPRFRLKSNTQRHRDDWTSVYRVLVNHPKIDVNAYLGQETTYVAYSSIGCTDARSPSRFGTLAWLENRGEGSRDDGMRPWDYACMIREQERGNTNSGYARNLMSLLIESGKLAPTGEDLIYMFRKAIASYEFKGYECGYPTKGEEYFLELVRQAELPALRHLVDIMDRDINAPGINLSCIAICVFKDSVMKHWAVLQRRRVLRCVRAIARGHIVAVRWWALAREASYAPGGEGFLRAHTSFENAVGSGQAVVFQ